MPTVQAISDNCMKYKQTVSPGFAIIKNIYIWLYLLYVYRFI